MVASRFIGASAEQSAVVVHAAVALGITLIWIVSAPEHVPVVVYIIVLDANAESGLNVPVSVSVRPVPLQDPPDVLTVRLNGATFEQIVPTGVTTGMFDGNTFTFCDKETLQGPQLMISVTGNVPADGNVYEGFCVVASAIPSLLKSQLQAVKLSAGVERSVKFVGNPAHAVLLV